MAESINVELFKAVILLAEQRSYTQVAQILNISTAVLKSRINTLEQRLEFRIFEPDVDDATVTLEGETFVNAVRSLLSKAKENKSP